jgi:serine/threonine protein kinase
LLSRGPFASVYVSKTPKRQYVVKQITKKNAEMLESLLHEAAMLTHISNVPKHQQYVVGFHGLDLGVSRNIMPALVFEKMECSLHDWTKHHLSASGSRRTSQLHAILGLVSVKLVAALSWLHDHAKVVHGDIKPSNILIRSSESGSSLDFTLCFADFASAVIMNELYKAQSGLTYAYMSPETLKHPHDPPTTAGDVWALAVSLLEVVAGRTPYSDVSPRMRKLAVIGYGEPVANVEDEVINAGCMEFAKRVLSPALIKDPARRTSATEWSSTTCLYYEPAV